MRVFGKIVLIALVVTGCTSLSTMQKFHEEGGQVQIYDVDYKTAYDLARHACTVLNFDIASEDYAKHYLVGQTGWSWGTYGERIGFYFREIDPKKTEIRIINEAKYKVDNLFKRDWETDAHGAIQTRYQQLKQSGLLT